MKKRIVLFLFILIFFCACPMVNFRLLPTLDVNFDKENLELVVGEKIILTGIIDKAYMNNEAKATFYIEDYPSDYQILRGTIYEQLTTEKYLCITPAQLKGTEGIVKVEMSFPTVGEYKIKVTGFASKKLVEPCGIWNEDFYTYTIVVKE